MIALSAIAALMLGAASLQEVIPLWPTSAPGAVGTLETDVPTLTVFTPSAPRLSRAAVIVFPGGGYEHLATDKEGVQIAKWFTARGATAFVVRYRLGPRYHHPTMQQDGMRAVRVVRASAKRFNFDPAHVAVMGFSAGGHLAGLVATHAADSLAGARDSIDRISARPDAALLIYPVVTMRAPFAHAGSRQQLLGEHTDTVLSHTLSIDESVTANTPPVFLAASAEDRTVPIQNSLQLYEALRAAHVSAELHVYARGPHGFGLAAGDPVLSTWPSHAAAWLSRTFAEPALSDNATADVTNAIVDGKFTGPSGAKVSGVPTYRTINAAIDAAPNFPETPWTIRIRAGTYREKVGIDKPNIRLIGAHRDSTVIAWGDYAGALAPGGGTLGTRATWTLRATQADVHLEHLTVANTFDYDANASKVATDSSKIRDTQGLAVAFTDKSDRAMLRDVVLRGHQDTFFADAGRTYVQNSRIDGNVDFIFGSGRLVIEDSDIISLDRGSTTNNGYIAAPSTDITSYGMLFLRSRLKKASPSMAPNSVSLGRPWHPGGNPRAVGMAMYVDCWMDNHIATKGWDRMSAGPMTNGERLWFEPEHARFAEYRSSGPGAIESASRRRLSDGDATSYSKALVLDGWNPEGTP